MMMMMMMMMSLHPLASTRTCSAVWLSNSAVGRLAVCQEPSRGFQQHWLQPRFAGPMIAGDTNNWVTSKP
jgi:hypothetical protein